MVRFKVSPDNKNRLAFLYSKLTVLLFLLTFSAIVFYLAGWVGLVAAVLIPFIVFNYYISLFVFLHHTSPDLPFFTNKEEWSQSVGQLYCSTIVRCSAFSEYLTHGILIHTPHHVDMRIPFYNLKGAYYDLHEKYSTYMHEMQFSVRGVRSIFKLCKLYDYDQHLWLNFSEARVIVANSKMG
jgi:omega-6 fatty acid desaturase (delta-12 desaturase)